MVYLMISADINFALFSYFSSPRNTTLLTNVLRGLYVTPANKDGVFIVIHVSLIKYSLKQMQAI